MDLVSPRSRHYSVRETIRESCKGFHDDIVLGYTELFLITIGTSGYRWLSAMKATLGNSDLRSAGYCNHAEMLVSMTILGVSRLVAGERRIGSLSTSWHDYF
jgi:hypothetical protein